MPSVVSAATSKPTSSHAAKNRWPVAIAGALIIVGAGVGWGMTGGPFSSDRAATADHRAVLANMAEILDEQLAGFQAGYTPSFARALAAARPAALANPHWPEADYALFQIPPAYTAPAKAVPLLVWIRDGQPAGGWATVCAEVTVERSQARLTLEAVHCPRESPTDPSQTHLPQEDAAMLPIAVKVRAELASGRSAKQAGGVYNFKPTAPTPATGPCTVNGLAATFDSGNSAGNTDDFILRIQNTSPEPRVLSEAVGLEVDLGPGISRLPWTQAKGALTLQPWASATMAISYRPEQGTDTHSVRLRLKNGSVTVAPPVGSLGNTLKVTAATPMTATAWRAVGYGTGVGMDNGRLAVDIAPQCRDEQIAVTTPRPGRVASGGDTAGGRSPRPLPYRLLNLSTRSCRIDPGGFSPVKSMPPLNVPETLVLQPGTSVDLTIEGDAPNLYGTLIVKGNRVAVEHR